MIAGLLAKTRNLGDKRGSFFEIVAHSEIEINYCLTHGCFSALVLFVGFLFVCSAVSVCLYSK